MVNFVANHFKPIIDHQITGKLCHIDDGTPIVDQKIALLAGSTKIAKGTTDCQGNFCFDFKRRSWIFETTASFTIRIKVAMRDGNHISDEIYVEKPLSEKEFDIGNQLARTFEFQQDMPIQLPPESLSRLPQGFPSISYISDLFEASFTNNLKEATKFFLDQEGVQKVFGSSDIELNEDAAREMIFNGICPCDFLKNSDGDAVHLINWDEYDRKENPLLPNVETVWSLEENAPRIKSIKIQLQGQEAQFVAPDSENFRNVLFLYLCAALVEGEQKSHLAKGHLINGMYALAIFRELKIDHPIRRLLEPLLSKVLDINYLGSGFIFKETGVLAITGLPSKSNDEGLVNTIGGLCHTSYGPRKKMYKDHRFAEAENLHWGKVEKSVERYFMENMQEIVEQWEPIKRLSDTLVRHCPEYKPVLTQELKDKGYSLFDSSELGDTSLQGRVSIDGVLKSLRPITKVYSNPPQEEIHSLMSFCKQIMQFNFWHFAVHASQEIWATNLHIASLAPENSNPEELGGTKPENAAKQLAVAKTLVDYEPDDYLLENRDGSVYQPYVDMLNEDAETFIELGYDIRKMPLGIEI